MEIALSLGSNLGDKLENLKSAKNKIADIPEVEVLTQSRVYETEPVGVSVEYADMYFLNAVIIIKSNLDLMTLAKQLHIIESNIGRVKNKKRNSPRPIDIDIIFTDSVCVSNQFLTVPHPRWAKRLFVVLPLGDIIPDTVISGENKTIKQLILSLPTEPKVVLFTDKW